MAKIVIALDEVVSCPDCGHEFPLETGITRQTIEHYEGEFEALLSERRKELQEQVTREVARDLERSYGEKVAQLSQQLDAQARAAEEARAQVSKVRAEVRASALAEAEVERKALAAELAEKQEKLKDFREQELVLRREKQQLEDAKRSLELDVQRKLDGERERIREEAVKVEAEKFTLREADYQKQLADARRAYEEVSRKLDQKSQQLQGAVLELEVEHALTEAFRGDIIEPVKVGARGADVIQTVRTPAGQTCGRIIWEAKRAENWSDAWLQKLRDDQRNAGAEVAVLVTTAMPKGIQEPFARVGTVWVVAPHALRPVGTILREFLIRVHQAQLANTGKNEKAQMLYEYLQSEAFLQRVRAVVETFGAMRHDLEREKVAIQKLWSKRQAQLDRASTSVTSIVGELEGIALGGLKNLASIEQLELPAEAAST